MTARLQLDDIIERLKDGEWHNIQEFQGIGATGKLEGFSKESLKCIFAFLHEFNIIEIREEEPEFLEGVKLTSNVLQGLKRLEAVINTKKVESVLQRLGEPISP